MSFKPETACEIRGTRSKEDLNNEVGSSAVEQ